MEALATSDYNLNIYEHKLCTTTGFSNPNEEPSSSTNCETLDDWNENLNAAVVQIEEDSEKETVELLIKNENILWIEPVYYNYQVSQSSSNNQDQQEVDQNPNNKFLIYVVTAVIILLLTWLIIHLLKKRIA